MASAGKAGSLLAEGVAGLRATTPVCEGFLWRRGWDLNPRYPLRYVRFRGGSFQPLTHLSAWKKLSAISRQLKPRFLASLGMTCELGSLQRLTTNDQR